MVRMAKRGKLPTGSVAALAAWTVLGAGALVQAADSGHAPPVPGLTGFQSDTELRQFLKSRRAREDRVEYAGSVPVPVMAMPALPSAVMAPQAAAAKAPGAADTASAASVGAASITNNQEADVDEGDIVKARGDTLVILRRGRLFTVSTVGGSMRPVDAIDAYPPGVDARGDWYDEMLVSGDRVVVIGYSYSRGGTQINRFRLSDDGHLSFEDAYQLKSNDYYSSENYASRLIGNRLIVYSPLDLNWQRDPLEALPALRRWSGQTGTKGFRRIAGGRQVFVSPATRRDRDAPIDTLHTVTNCDLSAPVLDCSAIAVLGPSSRNFYVSGRAVYLWTGENWSSRPSAKATSVLYRMPFQGRPSAVRTHGQPVDQFSFQEDRADDTLNVLVRSEGGGDGMWRPEFTAGSVSLLRLPLSVFGDGTLEARASRYRMLPKPRGDGYAFQNRFVGDSLLYGLGKGWGPAGKAGGAVTVVPVHGGAPTELKLPHSVDRIEALGGDAVVIGGADRDLVFSAIDLRGTNPRYGDRYMLQAASEGETRSHGFFYRSDTADGADGVLGLPVARPARPAYRQLFDSSAAMIFVRRSERKFSPLGELAAADEGAVDDGCVASCVDWYGNARPIFLGRRVFALMGYEMVEGEVTPGGIREIGRTSFAVQTRPRARGQGG